MSELLNGTTPVTVEEAGYKEVNAIEHGIEKRVLIRKEDLEVGGDSGADGGSSAPVDLSAYAKTADVAATYLTKADAATTYAAVADLDNCAKTADLTGAATTTAADGLKLLLVDGDAVKQITLAELKTYLGI